MGYIHDSNIWFIPLSWPIHRSGAGGTAVVCSRYISHRRYALTRAVLVKTEYQCSINTSLSKIRKYRASDGEQRTVNGELLHRFYRRYGWLWLWSSGVAGGVDGKVTLKHLDRIPEKCLWQARGHHSCLSRRAAFVRRTRTNMNEQTTPCRTKHCQQQHDAITWPSLYRCGSSVSVTSWVACSSLQSCQIVWRSFPRKAFCGVARCKAISEENRAQPIFATVRNPNYVSWGTPRYLLGYFSHDASF